MEKRKARLHSHSKDDVTNRKHTRSINGVLLEPGVTYIGKAVKEYFEDERVAIKQKPKAMLVKNDTEMAMERVLVFMSNVPNLVNQDITMCSHTQNAC